MIPLPTKFNNYTYDYPKSFLSSTQGPQSAVRALRPRVPEYMGQWLACDSDFRWKFLWDFIVLSTELSWDKFFKMEGVFEEVVE